MFTSSKKNFIVLFLSLITGFFFSCTKDEGPGGTSNIIGRVWVRDYNTSFTILYASYWAEEEDVYLIYGDDSIYSDRFKTNYDGSYWFQNLREGNYTVYAYSKDSTFSSESGRIPVKVSVNISGKKQDVEAPLITILK